MPVSMEYQLHFDKNGYRMSHANLDAPCLFLHPCEIYLKHIAIPPQSKYLGCKSLIGSIVEQNITLFDEADFQALVSELENQASYPVASQASVGMLRGVIGCAVSMPVSHNTDENTFLIELDSALLKMVNLTSRTSKVIWQESQNGVSLLLPTQVH